MGGMLLSNDAWPDLQKLTSEDFSLDSHRRIFRRMFEMMQCKIPVDLVTLASELKDHQELETIGGASYISSLTDGLPKLDNLKHYVKIVKDKAKRRQALWRAENITAAALDEAIPLRVVLDESKAASNRHAQESQFRVEDDGVYATVHTKDQMFDIYVCSPLTVAAVTRNEAGEEWGRLLEWQDIDKRSHRWAMPMSLLAGSGEDLRRALLGGGLGIASSQLARLKLTEYVQSARPERRAISVSKVGWHGDVFVLPDATIGNEENDGEPEQLYFYQPPQETWHNIRVRGRSEEWRDYIGKRCSGNSRLILAVACAFAAPLLTRTDSESGGFHFYGDSSKGKSTAQTVAGSVWGGGAEKGYLERWRPTANGLEIFAEVHNDGLGCLDEIGQIDARVLGEAVYMLANGQGKGRMSKSIGSRRRLTWSILFLSSGNVTLAQHMGEAGQAVHTALEVRLISITADAGAHMGMFENIHEFPDSKAFAEYMVSSAYTYYGAPIREFLKQVSSDRLRIGGKVRDRMETFARDAIPATAPSEIRRAGRRFGLCVAAGELATEWGLTGWSMNEVAPLVKKCLQDWISLREPSDSDRGVRAVKQALEMHGASRYQDIRGGENDRVINRAGYRRASKDAEELEYLIFPEVFRSEVCRGFDWRAVANSLKEQGFLIPG